MPFRLNGLSKNNSSLDAISGNNGPLKHHRSLRLVNCIPLPYEQGQIHDHSMIMRIHMPLSAIWTRSILVERRDDILCKLFVNRLLMPLLDLLNGNEEKRGPNNQPKPHRDMFSLLLDVAESDYSIGFFLCFRYYFWELVPFNMFVRYIAAPIHFVRTNLPV